LLLGYERKDYVKINKQIVNGCSLTIFDYDGSFHMEAYGINEFLPVVSKEAFIKQ
jgi:probable phosphoglycerate mutase